MLYVIIMTEYNALCFDLSVFVRCIIREMVVIQAIKRDVIAGQQEVKMECNKIWWRRN